MRVFLKMARSAFLALLSVSVLLYAADDLWARYRGRPVEQIKVGRLYSAVNHFNQVEYSVGTPVMETCVDSLLPHFGYSPCWYIRQYDIRHISP